MMNVPELVVMLTYQDHTVPDAAEIFAQAKNSKAHFWGFKEEGLDPDKMKELYAAMREAGKETFLEVVAYSEEEGLRGAQIGAQCGVDYLMGTIYSDRINQYCREHHLKYMPFVGTVTQRPSVLSGEIEVMIAQAQEYLKKGVYGIDLLGYRYTGDAYELCKRFVAAVDAPVCLAGSIDSFGRLDEVRCCQPWTFTIGSAFFEHNFGENMEQQINTVYDYMAGVSAC